MRNKEKYLDLIMKYLCLVKVILEIFLLVDCLVAML